MADHTYTAPRLDRALARVKRDLGADAAILSSRRLDDGGFEVRARAAEEAPLGPRPRAAAPLVDRLLERSGLEPDLARPLAASVAGEPRTLGAVQGALQDALRTHVAFEAPDLDRGRRVLALVGPTGVGKTTTLAKLAAHAALVSRRAVGLITLDGYRIGGVAQIQQYADLIGVPLVAAHDAPSFARAMRRLADAEVIFVDTPGRSPVARSAYAELAETLHSSGVDVTPILCIAAATRRDELDLAIERCAVLRPTHVAVTKVDEALRHDAVVAGPVRAGLPLSWMTAGQRVPEDVEVATPAALSALLCGQETE